MAYSYDGTNWTGTGSTVFSTVCNSVAARRVLPYVGTTVVPPQPKPLTDNFTVVGSYGYGSNQMIYSYDGLTWQPSPSGNTVFSAGGRVDCLAWNGATWLAGGISGTADGNHARLATSPDGINWTLVTTVGGGGGAYTNFFQLASNGSMWIILYSNLTSSQGYYSYDTITWTSTSVPYYARMGINGGNALGDGKLLEKINYMIHLLEEQQSEKTSNITEEFILYTFLGVFIIFIVDSFARSGKYTR
jgi:hypothetical protein